jgi:hypothetical protein
MAERGQLMVLPVELHLNADFSEFIEDNRTTKEALRMRNDRHRIWPIQSNLFAAAPFWAELSPHNRERCLL